MITDFFDMRFDFVFNYHRQFWTRSLMNLVLFSSAVSKTSSSENTSNGRWANKAPSTTWLEQPPGLQSSSTIHKQSKVYLHIYTCLSCLSVKCSESLIHKKNADISVRLIQNGLLGKNVLRILFNQTCRPNDLLIYDVSTIKLTFFGIQITAIL